MKPKLVVTGIITLLPGIILSLLGLPSETGFFKLPINMVADIIEIEDPHAGSIKEQIRINANIALDIVEWGSFIGGVLLIVLGFLI